jgi:hypothetical protein
LKVKTTGIFANEGVYARIKGWWRSGMAYANYDPAVAEYQALLIGFSPILARSIGHTGVLTQVDVDSTVQLFPKLGEGRDEALRKLENVMLIMSGKLPAPEYGQANPDGTITPVFVIDPYGQNALYKITEDGLGYELVPDANALGGGL